jgi:hypothetical protein
MKQMTIITEDKVGVIADISYILGKAKINIEAISAEVYGGKGVINLMVKDEEKATKLLTANGYKVLESELLVIKLKDEPGELSKVTSLLKKAKVNIKNLYILAKGEGIVIDALSVDKPKKAKKLLKDYLLQGE